MTDFPQSKKPNLVLKRVNKLVPDTAREVPPHVQPVNASFNRRDMFCIHCGIKCKREEGCVCDECYSRYTPDMLNDMDS